MEGDLGNRNFIRVYSLVMEAKLIRFVSDWFWEGRGGGGSGLK